MTKTPGDLVIIGQLGAAHGIRGWVKLNSFTDPEVSILSYSEWQLGHDDHWQKREVAESRASGQKLLVRLQGCEDRDQAQQLTGLLIAISRQQLPTPNEGEYYWADLTGCQVQSLNGQTFGIVDHLIETGSYDVMVIKKEEMVTAVPFRLGDVVKHVDIGKKEIVVDWEE